MSMSHLLNLALACRERKRAPNTLEWFNAMSAIASPQVRKQWLTVANAAEYVDCSTKTIRRLVATGKLQATYLTPRSMRVSLESLEALLRFHSTNQWGEA